MWSTSSVHSLLTRLCSSLAILRTSRRCSKKFLNQRDTSLQVPCTTDKAISSVLTWRVCSLLSTTCKALTNSSLPLRSWRSEDGSSTSVSKRGWRRKQSRSSTGVVSHSPNLRPYTLTMRTSGRPRRAQTSRYLRTTPSLLLRLSASCSSRLLRYQTYIRKKPKRTYPKKSLSSSSQ